MQDRVNVYLIEIMIIDQIIFWKGNHFFTAMLSYIFQSTKNTMYEKVFYSTFYSPTEYHVTTCQAATAS